MPIYNLYKLPCTYNASYILNDIIATPSHHHYRLSTNKKWMPKYPSNKNAPQKTDKPMTSLHSARLLNPKLDKMDEAGTSMSRPYLWSIRVR